MPNERRKHTRIKVGGSVEVTTDGGSPHTAQLCNFSMAGVYILPGQPMDLGEKCRIRFAVQPGAAIEFHGEVVRRSGGEGAVGVRITRIDVRNLRNLYKSLVAKHGDAGKIDAELFDDEFYIGQALEPQLPAGQKPGKSS